MKTVNINKNKIMTHYINKDALVAEIEKIQNEFSDSSDRNGNFDDLENQGAYKALDRLESFLNTLEVKEIDFDEEFNKYHIGLYNPFNSGAEIYEFAKHFFELGLKTKEK